MSVSSEPRSYHHGNLRATFLDAAERSLREHGADRLSLRDLARDIGVSHAAPRRHFADRDALLHALAEKGFDQLGSEIRAALTNSDTDFSARVRNAVVAYAHFATKNPALSELMNSSKHRSGAGRIVESSSDAFRPIVDLIVEGQESGALVGGAPERIGIILFATLLGITAMVNGGMVQASLLDELVDTAIRQFLRGAGPDA
jgi:AcrR family transcriptional regulator